MSIDKTFETEKSLFSQNNTKQFYDELCFYYWDQIRQLSAFYWVWRAKRVVNIYAACLFFHYGRTN